MASSLTKKKICLINLDLNVGGAQRYMADMANFLANKGYGVHIILLNNSPIFFDVDSSVTIVQPQFAMKKNAAGKIKFMLQLLGYIRQSLKKINPAVILNTASPAFILFATLGFKHSIYLSIRCNPENTRLIESFHIPLFIRRWLYKRTKGIVAQTSFAAKVLTAQMKHPNIITIPNPLRKLTVFNTPKKNQIISVGRLIKSKGFDYLIKSFAEAKIAGWQLLIVGDGPERENLEQLCNSLGVAAAVELVGSKDNVDELLQESKIFAFASLSEGFPNALLEAMGTPLPCISFDCHSGPADMIEDGVNGMLVPLKNTAMFTHKLGLLMQDENLRSKLMAQAIKTREKYAAEKIGEDYLRLVFENEKNVATH